MPAEKPSLYDRLGGVYSIATVVDDFIDRIMVDPRLNANPLVDEAHHRVPPAGFKYLGYGRPTKIHGKVDGDRDGLLVDSHAHLKITGKEWEAFLDDFQQTLDRFAVPAEEQAQLKAIVNSTRADIVVDFRDRGGSRLGLNGPNFLRPDPGYAGLSESGTRFPFDPFAS